MVKKYFKKEDMKMKKTFLTALASLLALCACNKTVITPDNGKTYSWDQLQFDFTIEREGTTKGVRDGWLNGDKVFVFFSGHSDVYVTVTFDGSAWSADPVLPDGMSVDGLAADGVVTAVYLPYGNDRTPSWNPTSEAWEFNGTNDYYYLQTQKTTYFITNTGNKLHTLGAYLYMETASDYVQFYLHDDSASVDIRLACNYVVPGGIAGISLDGTITDAADASVPGRWITARADTIDGDTGYYASGKLILRPGYHCYLTMDTGSGYKHYYKQRESPLSPNKGYILPAYADWTDVGQEVAVGGVMWSAVSIGATNPWDTGTAFTTANMSTAVAPGTAIPSDRDWQSLLDRNNAAWIQVSIAGTEGFIVLDRANPDNFLFLRSINYWSSGISDGNQHYMKSAADGTHELSETNPPTEAEVRLVSTTQIGTLNPPENGGGI